MQYQGIGTQPLQGLFVFLYNHDRTDIMKGKNRIVRRELRLSFVLSIRNYNLATNSAIYPSVTKKLFSRAR